MRPQAEDVDEEETELENEDQFEFFPTKRKPILEVPDIVSSMRALLEEFKPETVSVGSVYSFCGQNPLFVPQASDNLVCMLDLPRPPPFPLDVAAERFVSAVAYALHVEPERFRVLSVADSATETPSFTLEIRLNLADSEPVANAVFDGANRQLENPASELHCSLVGEWCGFGPLRLVAAAEPETVSVDFDHLSDFAELIRDPPRESQALVLAREGKGSSLAAQNYGLQSRDQDWNPTELATEHSSELRDPLFGERGSATPRGFERMQWNGDLLLRKEMACYVSSSPAVTEPLPGYIPHEPYTSYGQPGLPEAHAPPRMAKFFLTRSPAGGLERAGETGISDGCTGAALGDG